MDDVTWAVLTVVLTVLGAGYTYWAFSRRGAAAGLRGLSLTVLPAAAWLTGTLEMFTRIAHAIGDWATSLVFDPSVWIGTALGALAVVLWVAGGRLHARNATRAVPPGETSSGALPPSRPAAGDPVVDDDLADIEAILKRRGIS